MTGFANRFRQSRQIRALGFLRVFILLVAILAMLGVSMASASPAHFHPKPPTAGCDICFAVHFASLEAKALVAVPFAPRFHRIIGFRSVLSGYRLLRDEAGLTRGPPSLPAEFV